MTGLVSVGHCGSEEEEEDAIIRRARNTGIEEVERDGIWVFGFLGWVGGFSQTTLEPKDSCNDKRGDFVVLVLVV